MNRRAINHSTERAMENRRTNPRAGYERKCQTPSNQYQSTKKSSIFFIDLESKTKDGDKKHQPNSKTAKNLLINIPQAHVANKKDSPFKHKSTQAYIKIVLIRTSTILGMPVISSINCQI